MKTKIILFLFIVMSLALPVLAQKASKDAMPLFWIRENGKYGYIDKSGKVVIAPQFENTMGFSEGLAATRLNGKYGYIDTKGKWVIEPQFEFTYKFSNGVAMFRTGKQYGWIDRAGKIVIQPQEFEEVNDFSEGRAAVKRGGKWGYIDKTGKMVIEAKFKKGTRFNGGLAQVETEDGMHHWIAPDGKLAWSQKDGGKKKAEGHAEKKH